MHRANRGCWCYLFSAAFLIVILLASNVSVASEPAEVSLRLKWIYDPGFAGEMVAAKAGFFEKHGVSVKIRPGGFEADPIKLVASGSDTFGVTGADNFLLARSKGVPIVAFAAGYIETAVVFYALKDSGIITPYDFVGKRVGYQAGQDTATIYEALISKLRINPAEIKEVPVKYDFTPFLERKVDVWPGYLATQSYLLKKRDIPYITISPACYGINFLGTVYFVREDTLENQPEVVRGFLNGLIDGWRFTYNYPEKAIPIISSYDPRTLTQDFVKFGLEKQKKLIKPSGYKFAQFTSEQWDATQKVLIAQKLLSRPIDMHKAVDYSTLKAVYAINAN